MNRDQARVYLGKRVSAWTAVNGTYVGTLLVIIHTRPWRGVVEITGVDDVALPFEYGRKTQRRGFRPGELLEVGGVNIEPTTYAGTSYLHALERELESNKRRMSSDDLFAKRYCELWEKTDEEVRKQIAAAKAAGESNDT